MNDYKFRYIVHQSEGDWFYTDIYGLLLNDKYVSCVMICTVFIDVSYVISLSTGQRLIIKSDDLKYFTLKDLKEDVIKALCWCKYLEKSVSDYRASYSVDKPYEDIIAIDLTSGFPTSTKFIKNPRYKEIMERYKGSKDRES